MLKRISPILTLIALSAIPKTCYCQDLPIYADALENGYVNWSWSDTDLSSKTYTHSGKTSIKVTYSAPWQAFRAHGPSYPTALFSSLTFWINGGTTARRSISISGLKGGNALPGADLNQFIAGGKVPANGWAKVTVPLSALGLKPTDKVDGFWLQDTTGKTQPSYWIDDISWTATLPPANITVNVSNVPVRTLDYRHFGVNTTVYNTILDTAKTKSRVAEAGFKMFRFPGGSLSDSYHWQTNQSDGFTWKWQVNFDQFADLAKTVGAQSFITANYGSGTATEAAAWVTYSKQKGYGFKYWELGNECYGTWENDTHKRKQDPYLYAQDFANYYKLMKAADPTIKVGAVAVPGEDSSNFYTDHPATNPRTGKQHNGWTPVMLATLATLGVTPDYLIYHRYPEYPGIECDFGVLQSQDGWVTDISDLRQELKDYLPKGASQVEILCNENNVGGGGKQETSLVDGLYLADSFGSVIQTECNSYLFWDLYNAQKTDGNFADWLYGWRTYGDDGMLDPTGAPYPAFYVEKLISKFAAPGETVLSTTSSSPWLSSYAVKKADGSVAVLLVNKSPRTTFPIQTTIAQSVNKATIQVYGYGISQDNAAKTGVGSPDIYGKKLTNLATNYSYDIAPYSAVVLIYPKK